MKNGLLLFCFIMSWSIHAQTGSTIPDNVRAVNTIEQLTYNSNYSSNEKMFGIELPEGKVIGDTYLNASWKRSAILLYDGERLIKNYEVRYDILSDAIIVKTPAGLRALAGDKVQSFTWMDSVSNMPSYFVNAKSYKFEGSSFIGFFEVLADGKLPLLKRTVLNVKKADYNVQLAVGSRDDKIFKKFKYYYSRNNEVFELPTTRKKLLAIFETHKEEMEKFIDSNQLSTRTESEADEIFKHYNALIK